MESGNVRHIGCSLRLKHNCYSSPITPLDYLGHLQRAGAVIYLPRKEAGPHINVSSTCLGMNPNSYAGYPLGAPWAERRVSDLRMDMVPVPGWAVLASMFFDDLCLNICRVGDGLDTHPRVSEQHGAEPARRRSK
jgi:hypothetical protein